MKLRHENNVIACLILLVNANASLHRLAAWCNGKQVRSQLHPPVGPGPVSAALTFIAPLDWTEPNQLSSLPLSPRQGQKGSKRPKLLVSVNSSFISIPAKTDVALHIGQF